MGGYQQHQQSFTPPMLPSTPLSAYHGGGGPPSLYSTPSSDFMHSPHPPPLPPLDRFGRPEMYMSPVQFGGNPLLQSAKVNSASSLPPTPMSGQGGVLRDNQQMSLPSIDSFSASPQNYALPSPSFSPSYTPYSSSSVESPAFTNNMEGTKRLRLDPSVHGSTATTLVVITITYDNLMVRMMTKMTMMKRMARMTEKMMKRMVTMKNQKTRN